MTWCWQSIRGPDNCGRRCRQAADMLEAALAEARAVEMPAGELGAAEAELAPAFA